MKSFSKTSLAFVAAALLIGSVTVQAQSSDIAREASRIVGLKKFNGTTEVFDGNQFFRIEKCSIEIKEIPDGIRIGYTSNSHPEIKFYEIKNSPTSEVRLNPVFTPNGDTEGGTAGSYSPGTGVSLDYYSAQLFQVIVPFKNVEKLELVMRNRKDGNINVLNSLKPRASAMRIVEFRTRSSSIYEQNSDDYLFSCTTFLPDSFVPEVK